MPQSRHAAAYLERRALEREPSSNLLTSSCDNALRFDNGEATHRWHDACPGYITKTLADGRSVDVRCDCYCHRR